MLRKGHILASIFIAVSIITVVTIQAQSDSTIPLWIKTTAGFWVNDQVTDSEFLSAIQYLIKEGILVIPQDEVTTKSSSTQPDSAVTTPSFSKSGIFGSIEFEKNSNAFKGFFALAQDITKPFVTSYADNGKFTFKIINSDKKEVFNDRKYVVKDTFEPYESEAASGTFLAIPIYFVPGKIMSSSSSSGTLYISFESNRNNEEPLTITTFIDGLPTQGGSSSSTSSADSWKVGRDMNVGPFKMTVGEVSFVKDQNSPYGEYLRVDLTIYNKRSETVELNFSQLTLKDDANFIYDVDWTSRYQLETDYPEDTSKKGYLLFENVPKNTKKIELFFEVVVIADIYTSDNYHYSDELEINLS